MFMLPIATDPPLRRLRGPGLSVAAHLAAVSAIFLKPWLAALLAMLFASWRTEPLPITDRVIILAPPPGTPAPRGAHGPRSGVQGDAYGGMAARIDDGTDLAWEPDDRHELMPVLRAHNGMIVFTPLLDRTHPVAAFRADGSRVQPPKTLTHYIRLRMANPAWWPEVSRFCAIADPARALEVMAVFPPEYRSALGEAAGARMVAAGMKAGSAISGLRLALDASRPEGVAVLDVSISPSAPSPAAAPAMHIQTPPRGSE